MIQNKDYIIYSLESAISNLDAVVKESVKVNVPKHKEVYYALGTTLLWIGACINRLDEINAKYSVDEEYIKAFKGAYNAQKHGINLVDFTGFISGNQWPLRFPMRFGDGNYYFKELNENIIKSKNQIVIYNKILKDKDIVESVNIVKEIIMEKVKIDD